MTIPSDQLVQKFVEYRDFLEKKQAEFDEAMKPYRDAMETITNEVHARLNADGLDNIKTPFGTAYKSNTLSVKVADRSTFFDYIFKTNEEEWTLAIDEIRRKAESFFTANIAKDPVKEFLEQHQAPPPGVDVTTVTKVLFRRA